MQTNTQRMVKHLTLLFFSFMVIISSSLYAESKGDDPTVLIAILARNKAHVLPTYLECLEKLDYNKKLLTLYINTNNNQDLTQEILTKWVDNHKDEYKQIVFEEHQVQNLPSARPHEWNAERFKVLGQIRNKSLQKTKEYKSDYYFVIDCDNFIRPSTLKELIGKNKPIIAPLLRALPESNDGYSNYFCDVSESGYYRDHSDYAKILQRSMVGTFKVPVVHCTYLIQAPYIDKLTYIDGTDDYEFVIFLKSARQNNVDQYICNEKEFGYLLHFYEDVSLEVEKQRFQAISRNLLVPQETAATLAKSP